MGTGDEDLVGWLEGAREGDERALARLLAHVRPRIEAYLRDRVKSHPSSDALAEELTQDTLLKVTTSIEECRAETAAQLMAWVRTIARRTAIDAYRRRRSELDRRTWNPVGAIPATVWADMVLESGATPSGREHSTEVDRALGRLVFEAQNALSAGTQIVVRRRLLYGDSWREAGAVIGTTAGGAKRRWQRAQKRLKEAVLRRVAELPGQLRRDALRRLGEVE